MKLLTLSFLSLLFSAGIWQTDWQKAKAEASESNKQILLSFSGSDWCGPCIRMHEQIFESTSFESFASNNLVLVNADFPRLSKHQLSKELTRQNEQLADQYNKKGIFPLTLLLDEKGKVLKTWEGFPNETPEKFISEINSVIHAP
jgi:thioredoxin-related protein